DEKSTLHWLGLKSKLLRYLHEAYYEQLSKTRLKLSRKRAPFNLKDQEQLSRFGAVHTFVHHVMSFMAI
ncbi:MAG: hypothetical protein NZ703_00875, partial [Gemmataceae bacterium]|nr:hypothetical protein [Gemmataceae bacterium]